VAAVALDVDAIRARFSSLRTEWALFDGPGGTQTPDAVIEAIAAYLRESNANLGGAFEASVRSDALVTNARIAAAAFLGCTPDEVAFGQNMTTLNFALTRTVGRELRAGDEILATKLDHDGNVAPWLELARDLDLTVQLVELNDDTTLDLGDLESKLNERTRVVAFPLASNGVGTLVDARRVADLAHSVGALAWADAVHFGPHGPIDVAALGVDVLLCSPYKFLARISGSRSGARTCSRAGAPTRCGPPRTSLSARASRRARSRTSSSPASSPLSTTCTRSAGTRSRRTSADSASASSLGFRTRGRCTGSRR
jgi:selenocysteine lyase/cysteine desulfurase